MTYGKLQRNGLDAKTILKDIIKLNLIIGLLVLMSGNIPAQVGNGSSIRESKDTSGNADQNLKSIARVNPSTLAMEFSLPFMSYPGRNGNSLPVGISYSSKLWRMQTRMQWWYPLGYQTRYVTDIYTEFAKHSAAGWTSSLASPKLVEKDTIYDESGQPYSDRLFNEAGINNHWQNILSGFAGENNMMPCGTHCNHTESWGQPDGPPIVICVNYILIYCETGGGGGGPNLPEPPPPVQLYSVKRIEVTMPNGSTHEFRKDDSATHCGTSSSGCSPGSWDGTYLSVDGSAMKVVHHESGARTLYLPNGSKYEFLSGAATEQVGIYASKYIDVDGNIQSFSSSTESNINTKKWTDTLGREIVDPLSNKLTQDVDVPGLDNDPLKYKVKWENLKPPGCETITDPNCTNEAGQVGGALEDQTWKLYYETRYFCRGNSSTDLLTNPNNLNDPNNEVLFPHRDTGIRPCNSFNILLNSLGEPVLDENNLVQPFAARFNPKVLSEVELPNGKKYIFKYNRYGEISKVIYPTGSYETFTYGFIEPMNGSGNPAYDQTNRGVTERCIYSASSTTPQQCWQYSAAFNYASGGNSTYKITTIAPKGNDPLGIGIKTERYLHIDYSDGGNFGFSDPRAGMPKEEKTYDENGVLRSRTLTRWITKDIGGNEVTVSRDPRAEQSVSVMIENGLALATLGKTVYDTAASTDAEHFSHLNAKSSKGYHYKVIDLSTAQTGSFDTIAGMFTNDVPASVAETDYQYDPNYKARGIPSLPVETRVLNPANSTVIARTQTVYDEPSRLVADSGSLSGNLAATWSDPGTTLRGKPTTGKVWDSDNNYWIETHTQYDQYGNVRKAWEASTATTFDPTRFVETQYSSDYAFAYPTRVIAPPPDPTGMHGTNLGSEASTTYDFTTGLPLTATNDFGQTIATEYNDDLLRPTRSYGVGQDFVIPVTETIYDDNGLTVTVRKQIDATNWDEATSYSDSLGRTIKTRSKDSQGDVFVETHYDFLGRVKTTTNPYRLSDTNRYFSRPRYDEMGRAVEGCAPVIESAFDGNPSLPCPSGKSLGTTEYGISTAPGFVGTSVMTTDAAGKKGRAITNALGQLTRVDEPDHAGGLTALPQSTPNPNPTPNPSPTPIDPPPPTCSVECLTNTEYPSYATVYRYNEQGKMVEVIQGDQHRYFKYDSLGRLIRVRQPEQEINPNVNLDLPDNYNTSGKWTAAFSYDVMGNVVTAIDANGTQINYTYDKASRVKTRTYSDGTPAVSYYYDGKGLTPTPDFSKGKLTKVTSSVSETRYTKFDKYGRLTESEQRTPFGEEMVGQAEARISKYEYNLSGALVKQTYPNGRVVENQFEADGDLARIYGKANVNATERTYANSFSYTPDGRIEKLKLGNYRWEWAKFNERLQVTELNLGSGVQDASLWKLKYEYGEINSNGDVDTSKNTGNIARLTTSFNGLATPFVQTFKYDSLYRLVEAKEESGTDENWKQMFSYDRYGNRNDYEKYLNRDLQNLDPKEHPAINPLTNRFSSSSYTYDFNGNLLGDADGRNFTFNGDNKQSEIRNGTTLLARYLYDGEGKRVKKLVYNPTETVKEETVFVYDGLGKLIAEYSTAIPPPNPTTSYTMTDQLGSPRVITNSQGEVVSRRDFMPFGEELANDPNYRTAALKYNTNDGIRQKFTGYQKDEETNLDFAEARMYENRHARFTAVDPLLASGRSANPQSFNRYVYVVNNPINKIDPTGLIDWFSKYNEQTGRTEYQWSEDNKTFEDGTSVDGWTQLPFGRITGEIIVDDACVNADCTETNILYLQQGGKHEWFGFLRDMRQQTEEMPREFGKAFSYESLRKDWNYFWKDPLGEKGLGNPGLGFVTGGLSGFASFGKSLQVGNVRNINKLVGFGDDAAIIEQSANLIPKKGWYDVVIHGTEDGLAFTMNSNRITPKHLYSNMLANGYQPGTRIRLMSCYSGMLENGAAFQLSKLANAPVVAPRSWMTIGNGNLFEKSRFYVGDGKWFTIFK